MQKLKPNNYQSKFVRNLKSVLHLPGVTLLCGYMPLIVMEINCQVLEKLRKL